MLDLSEQLLQSSSWLSWRELIRLVLLSGLFALVCFTAFPRNAPSKRILLMISAATLMVLPWLIKGDWLVWHMPLEQLPGFSLSYGLPEVLLWAWLCIATVLLVRYAFAINAELRQVHRLTAITDRSPGEHVIHTTLDILCERLDMPRPVLRYGDVACSTSVYRPTIVLPMSAKQWTDSTLASVLAHELVHIRRRDDLWLMAFRVCLLVYWWMPWINPMYAAFVRCIEESCDDQAAECIGHDLTYVEALAGVAVNDARPGFVSTTSMHEHHLVGRIGRFRQLRQVELDTSGVYWSVIGVIGLAALLSGVEPVQKLYAADVLTVQQGSARPGQTDQAIFPVTHQYTLFPTPLPPAQQHRLHNPVSQSPVIYPGSAIRQGTEGVVTIGFLVQADGAVSNPRIISSEPAGVFDHAALRAVLNSRYTAARLGATRQAQPSRAGSLGAVEVQRYFAFRLETQ